MHYLHSMYYFVIFAIILLGAALRAPALFDAFWVDEVWSLKIAQSVSSPLEIFTSIHHDNNHMLNTLFLYLLGDQSQWFIYRFPSFLFGMGSIVLAGIIAHRRGQWEAATAMLLFSFSYPMILYSTEARGYSPAVFFALLAFLLINHYRNTTQWRHIVLFWGTTVLGFLSHLSFAIVYLAFVAWILVSTQKQ